MYFCTVDPPVITVQPTDVVDAVQGTDVDFSVTVTGLTSTFQWMRGGMDITDAVGEVSGATTATLTITSITNPDDEGDYTVVVTNAAGTVTSDVASLTVGEFYVLEPCLVYSLYSELYTV